MIASLIILKKITVKDFIPLIKYEVKAFLQKQEDLKEPWGKL